MKAHVIKEFGDITRFEVIERDKPVATPGHVVIAVKASSVNPVDTKIRSGVYAPASPEMPAILHGDVAGVIESVGEGVTEFKVGDEIYGCAGGVVGTQGALAEFMLADAKLLAKKPKSLSFAEAAALPLVSITAWEALFDKSKLVKGQHVLIHAGTGGVGHVAIQLAKSVGARVATTISSSEKADIVKSLGADDVINYRDESVEDYVKRVTDGKGFELIFDTVGGENLLNSFVALALYGSVVTIQANVTLDLSGLQAKSGTLHDTFMLIPLIYNVRREHHGEILTKVAKLVDSGKVKPLIDAEQFTFDEIGNAHARLESGKALGKVVVSV